MPCSEGTITSRSETMRVRASTGPFDNDVDGIRIQGTREIAPGAKHPTLDFKTCSRCMDNWKATNTWCVMRGLAAAFHCSSSSDPLQPSPSRIVCRRKRHQQGISSKQRSLGNLLSSLAIKSVLGKRGAQGKSIVQDSIPRMHFLATCRTDTESTSRAVSVASRFDQGGAEIVNTGWMCSHLLASQCSLLHSL